MATKEQLLEIELKAKNGIKLSKDEKAILKENNAEAKAKKGKMSFGERMQAASKSEYSQLMGDDQVDKFPIRDYIDTGNVLLNAQISANGKTGGMPSGRVWQLAGESSVGKTYLGLETLKNAQKQGYFGILYDSEMANNDKEALKKRGINTNNLLYIPIDTVENLKTSMLNIIEEAESTDKIFIMVDSIGNLSTRKELEDSIDGSTTKDMTRPAQLKALFRTVTIKAGVKNVPVIAINHTYANMGGFGGPVIAGGGGPAYNSSITNQFSKAQEKDSKGNTSGALLTSTVTKCRTAKEKTKVKFTIDFEDGLTRYSGLEQFCLDEKLIEKSSIKEKDKAGKEKKIDGFAFTKKTGKDGFVKKFTDEIWEEFLEGFLYNFLHEKFSYQSVSEELGIDEEEDDEEE
jgi:RecA/RadA recombinase